MGYFTEGGLLAHMAILVVKRRRPEDRSALELLAEMIDPLGLPGAEFANNENWPGHPLGDLICEAFGDGQKFPILASINISHPTDYKDRHTGDHSDGVPFTQEQEDAETQAYYLILDRFKERFHL